MRKALMILAMLTIATTTHAERSDSFRGHIFYDEMLDKFPGLELKESGNIMMYSLPGDQLTVGDAKLDAILYGFYKDRFYSVMIDFHGLENMTTIKEILRQKYGLLPDQPNRFMPKFVWKSLLRGVTITLDYRELLGTGTVIYTSDLLSSEIQLDAEKSAKAAKAGL